MSGEMDFSLWGIHLGVFSIRKEVVSFPL